MADDSTPKATEDDPNAVPPATTEETNETHTDTDATDGVGGTKQEPKTGDAAAAAEKTPAEKAADTRAKNKQLKDVADTQAKTAEGTKASADDQLAQQIESSQAGAPDQSKADQKEEVLEDKETLYADTLSNIAPVDVADTVAIIGANTSVPKYRQASKTVTKTAKTDKESEEQRAAAPDDIPVEVKKSPSDLNYGEGKDELPDPQLQVSREAEFASKEASKSPQDGRDSVFSPNEDTTEEGDPGVERADETEPDYVVGQQHALTVTDELTFTEIASRLGFGQPSVKGREIAALNGITNGNDNVTQGQRILLPLGYDYK
jgi:hypothetical protein